MSIHWPHCELQIRENGILKLHTNLEILASNPILKTHFFRVRKKRCLQKKLCLMGPICSMKRHKFWPARFGGKIQNSCQTDPYQNGWRHLAENFFRETSNFFRHLYGHRRGLKSCESGILKLRTVLEIMVPNPILETHFFRVRKKRCLQIFYILGGLMCPTKWHKLR